MKKKEIVIIGGGFAGIAAAKSLLKENVSITLIDKRNHHVFQPLLYQVATALLSPAQIAYPIRAIFKGKKNIRVLIGHVNKIDRAKKEIHLNKSKQTFHYDYLIVAAGARHSYFGNDQWEEHAWGLKTTKDALLIRERLLYSFEKAERTRFEDKKKRFTTFVIVGAGPTGVEMAGAIAEMTQKTLTNEFQSFNPSDSKIILVEGTNCVLNRYHDKLSKVAQKDLEKMGVEVRLNAMVTHIDKNGVKIGDEFIETENIIWAAGNTAAPLIKNITDNTNRFGQAEVKPDFSIQEDHNVFCIGDCAFLKDTNDVIVPAIAPAAMQAGKFVAKQIKNDLKAKSRDIFTYFDKGKMATIGHSRAVADLAGIKLTGFIAWLLWSFIHVLFLVNFKSKLLVLFDWVVNYISHKRSIRLINMYREK